MQGKPCCTFSPQGAFEWRFRSRIRVTLCGERIHEPPIQLHEQELLEPDRKFSDCMDDERRRQSNNVLAQLTNTRVLPTLALNEVRTLPEKQLSTWRGSRAAKMSNQKVSVMYYPSHVRVARPLFSLGDALIPPSKDGKCLPG